jgi:hypothetical protein
MTNIKTGLNNGLLFSEIFNFNSTQAGGISDSNTKCEIEPALSDSENKNKKISTSQPQTEKAAITATMRCDPSNLELKKSTTTIGRQLPQR